jgi:hypothetical protein
MSCVHEPSPNPRNQGCVKCGQAIEPSKRPRDVDLERRLTEDATKQAGYVDGDRGLTAMAEERALPGGVRYGLDDIREAREELADCRNYLVWGIERIHDAYLAGDPDAADRMVMNMDALVAVVRAWRALRS